MMSEKKVHTAFIPLCFSTRLVRLFTPVSERVRFALGGAVDLSVDVALSQELCSIC